MTRQELLRIVIRQARVNGFPFRKWFQNVIDPAWDSFDDAVETLSQPQEHPLPQLEEELRVHKRKV